MTENLVSTPRARQPVFADSVRFTPCMVFCCGIFTINSVPAVCYDRIMILGIISNETDIES